MSRQPVRAGPISTATRPSGSDLGLEQPGDGLDRTRRSPVSRGNSQATQRVALPQASASLPSALRMRMKSLRRRIARRLEHDELVAADAGVPVGEGARRRRVEREPARGGASSTTKSLPSPCILRNGIRPMPRAYRRRRRAVQRRGSASVWISAAGRFRSFV